MRRAVVVIVLVACAKREEPVAASVVALPSATGATVADAAAVKACTASYACSLSHPGLGSRSRSTAVDLGTCTRSSATDSGPYDPTSPRNPTPPTVSKLAAADCERLRDLASLLGPAEATASSESARMDTEACRLTLTCPGDAAARFQVQRQTTTGATLVERTIRAVLGAAP